MERKNDLPLLGYRRKRNKVRCPASANVIAVCRDRASKRWSKLLTQTKSLIGYKCGMPKRLGETHWAKFVKYAAPPSEDTLVMVCGLPGLYDAFCGPRTEAGVQKRTILHKLGYTAEMVAKF